MSRPQIDDEPIKSQYASKHWDVFRELRFLRSKTSQWSISANPESAAELHFLLVEAEEFLESASEAPGSGAAIDNENALRSDREFTEIWEYINRIRNLLVSEIRSQLSRFIELAAPIPRQGQGKFEDSRTTIVNQMSSGHSQSTTRSAVGNDILPSSLVESEEFIGAIGFLIGWAAAIEEHSLFLTVGAGLPDPCSSRRIVREAIDGINSTYSKLRVVTGGGRNRLISLRQLFSETLGYCQEIREVQEALILRTQSELASLEERFAHSHVGCHQLQNT